ncbi:hypothetical protein B0J11DRAFT_532606 [Dendryphion nanum]|uniref:Uncharacterized protein n=1 Tax=Dendryphion nanum TaxID=256645 RepID=A0A9P9IIJ3_9PLEO|nr:hypothetical protein B0J11DRAFT_532606 [Dendryphion nanum]
MEASSRTPSLQAPPKTNPLSPLELLPPEIRLQIYEYLGFPPSSKRLWLHPWNGIHCFPRTKIMSIHRPAPESRDEWIHDLMKLTAITFYDPFCRSTGATATILRVGQQSENVRRIPRAGKAGQVKVLIERKCEEGCVYCRRVGKWMPFEVGMMGVNRRIHGELCGMLYGGVVVEFRFELSERAVHFSRDFWEKHGRKYWGGYAHMGTHPAPLAISAHTFLHFTSIFLSPLIGTIHETKTPSHTRYYYTRVVRRQADSIRFLARHCPNLVRLKYTPHIVAIKTCKRYQLLDWIGSAYELLVRKCTELRELEVSCGQYYGRCGCSTRDPTPTNGDIKICETYGLSGSGERGEEDVERVGRWVRETVLRMRLKRDLLVECTNGLWNKPGPGVYHGKRSGGTSHGLVTPREVGEKG